MNTDIKECAKEFINTIISPYINKINIIKKFTKYYVDDLLITNFYSPLLIEYNYYLNEINSEYDNTKLDEICMICNDDINNEIIIYKCKQCSCYLHHSCANNYFINCDVDKCMQCKTEYNLHKHICILNFNWVNNQIENPIIHYTTPYYNEFKSSTVKIYYLNKFTKKIITDIQLSITHLGKPFIMIYIQSNNINKETDNTYTVYIYKYEYSLCVGVLIMQIDDFDDDGIIELY
jgi:hypothetical protein